MTLAVERDVKQKINLNLIQWSDSSVFMLIAPIMYTPKICHKYFNFGKVDSV